MDTPLTIADYETLASETLDRGVYDYFAGGAGDEITLALNASAYDRVLLRPRVLVDMTRVDTTIELFGQKLAMPILLAPAAFHKLAHPDGECATARAAGAAGTVFALSTVSSTSIEDVAKAATGPLWFQIYAYKDPAITRDMVQRAEAAGYKALVLTVDTPRLGRRERDIRNHFALPPGVEPANFAALHHLMPEAVAANQSPFAVHVQSLFDTSLSWKTVEALRGMTKLPLLLKGVVTPEDATLAMKAGVAGLVVSNHGGRQLDGAEPTILSLPRVADAVAGAMPVLVDGGIRRGVHVLKALALGASAVLIGRPYLWGLAANGEQGVRDVIELLRAELELAMALSCQPNVASITRALATID